MKNVFYLVLFLLAKLDICAQEILPTIKATSMRVDIRIEDDDYFAKGGWTLDPTKNPDIFSIGSKWLYDTKKVTFITDIDSVSLNVHPNGKYNFIILLNEKKPCYIQITTSANPIFMSKKILIPLLFGFIIILMLFYLNKNNIHTNKRLHLGYAIPVLFWCMTFLSGYLHGDYNHFKNVISELGAIGTKSEIFTSSSLMILAVLCILFLTSLYKALQKCKLSVIPVILSFSMPITMIWAGVLTLGNEFHSLTGPLPFLIIFACLIAYFLWRKNKAFSSLSKISLLCFFISLLILLRLVKPFGYEFEGLIQRFFYLAWSIWTISITYFVLKKRKAIEK